MENAFHESKRHGQNAFRYAVYLSDIPKIMRSFPLHWHDEMEIIYVENGTGCITVQSETYTVNSGDTVIIVPQAVHSISGRNDCEMMYFNILFDFSLLNCAVNDVCYDKYLKPVYSHELMPPVLIEHGTPLSELLLPHILYLIENRAKAVNGDELMIKSHLFAVMDILVKHSVKWTACDSLKNNYEKLRDVLDYISKNFGSQITVNDAAKICMYSPSYFMKIFKELTGTSFSQYLIDYRLEIAARRLNTGMQITDAATECGFNNLSYFTRSFTKKYGVTPSAYKKHNSK